MTRERTKTDRVQFRTTPEEKKEIERAALKLFPSIAAYFLWLHKKYGLQQER